MKAKVYRAAKHNLNYSSLSPHIKSAATQILYGMFVTCQKFLYTYQQFRSIIFITAALQIITKFKQT